MNPWQNTRIKLIENRPPCVIMGTVGGKVVLPKLTFRNGKTVELGDWIIPIPDGYHYSTDPTEMYEGKKCPLLIVPDSYAFSDNPDDASFSIRFESLMPIPKEKKGVEVRPESLVGIKRFLYTQFGYVFQPDVTMFEAGVRDGYGAFYQLFGDDATHSLFGCDHIETLILPDAIEELPSLSYIK